MTTISQTQFLTEILDLNAEQIPLGKLSFLREQFRHRVQEVVLRKYLAVKDSKPDFTKRILARRTGHTPEQVTRWLGAAGNLTLDTVCDLLLGMGAYPDILTLNPSTLISKREDDQKLENMIKRREQPQPRVGLPRPPANTEQERERPRPRVGS